MPFTVIHLRQCVLAEAGEIIRMQLDIALRQDRTRTVEEEIWEHREGLGHDRLDDMHLFRSRASHDDLRRRLRRYDGERLLLHMRYWLRNRFARESIAECNTEFQG